ncbi:MAG: NAD(P)-dependent oxidoreductase [Bacilli bacterium]
MQIVMLEDLKVSKEILDKYTKYYLKKGHELIVCNKQLDDNDKIKLLSNAHIAIIGNQPFNSNLVEAASKLEFLSVGFTGCDHLDKSVFNTNIKISNASGYATVATAELTIAMILNVLRNTVILDKIARNGKTMVGFMGNELSGKTVGIIGQGKIGSHVRKILECFGAKVLVNDIMSNNSYDLDKLLNESDIVTIHCPLNESTKGMFNKKMFSKMKTGAFLINCARGLIIDDSALIDALDSGKIKTCGLDVFDEEPPLNSNHKLLNHKNIIITPHIAYASVESMEKRIKIVFENIDAFLDGKQINIIK